MKAFGCGRWSPVQIKGGKNQLPRHFLLPSSYQLPNNSMKTSVTSLQVNMMVSDFLVHNSALKSLFYLKHFYASLRHEQGPQDGAFLNCIIRK